MLIFAKLMIKVELCKHMHNWKIYLVHYCIKVICVNADAKGLLIQNGKKFIRK